MTESETDLAGLRILVLEDEALIAMDIEDMLLDLECEPVGPVSTIENAIALIRSDDKLDGVLLDMNLHGEPVQPIVEELASKDIAFILVTGYARHDDESLTMRSAPRLNKPFSGAELSEILTVTFS